MVPTKGLNVSVSVIVIAIALAAQNSETRAARVSCSCFFICSWFLILRCVHHASAFHKALDVPRPLLDALMPEAQVFKVFKVRGLALSNWESVRKIDTVRGLPPFKDPRLSLA